MQYILLLHHDEQGWAKMPEAEMKKAFQAYVDYTQELVTAGVMKRGEPLAPVATAKTLRAVNGKIAVTDGPYVESKEQIGGYYILEVKSEAEAVEWARKCPALDGGAVEVRRVILPGEKGSPV